MKRLLLLLTACATMRSEQMPPRCRQDYDMCLSSCQGRPVAGPTATPGTQEYDVSMRNNNGSWNSPTQPNMSCAGNCDKNAETCARPATVPLK